MNVAKETARARAEINGAPEPKAVGEHLWWLEGTLQEQEEWLEAGLPQANQYYVEYLRRIVRGLRSLGVEPIAPEE